MKQALVLILILFVLGGIGLVAWFNSGSDDMNEVIKDNEIAFEHLDEKIYTSARAWGLGGNHEEIVLSSSPMPKEHKSYEKEKCYIFYTNALYYKIDDESNLIIYVDQSSISKPSAFESEVKIIIHGLRTSTELMDYSLNYDDYGLIKVSMFE